MPRSDRLQRPRRIDGHAVAAIAPVVALIPAWMAAVFVFWLPVTAFLGVSYWLFSGVVFLMGMLLFLRPVQRIVLRRMLGARPPDRTERDALQRAWHVVAQANHIEPGTFVFGVADSDDLNAFASGGHLVVVSSWAVHNLSHDDLCGVLAHELSHHLGMHTVALTIGQWLTVPIVLLARVGFLLQNVAHAATDTFAARSQSGAIIGRSIAGALTIFSWLFLSMITVSQIIGNIVGKGSEFRADEMVVAMGFGKQLRNSLRLVIAQGDGDRPVHWRDRLVSAHPPARTRVARIDANLRKTPGNPRR